MIRCLAIDDEPLALQQLASYVGQVSELELVQACRSAQEAREILNREHIDAIFIDINMPDLSGLDFVRSLASPPLVVFTTAYSEYAVEGFRLDAVDYLLKPFGLDDFKRAATRLLRRHEAVTMSAVSGVDDDDAIFLKTDYKIVRIQVSDIVYIEAMSEYLRIHLDAPQRPVTVLLSMKKMEERLPGGTFMRVHRSHIINLKKIKEVSKNHITLINEVSLPIGDLYKESFVSYLNKKFLTK